MTERTRDARVNSEDYLLSKLMSEALLPPEISTSGIQSYQPGFKFGNHVYADEVEIVYVMHGASYVGIDKQYIRVKKNDCLLIFPKVTHNYFFKENESCILYTEFCDPDALIGSMLVSGLAPFF